MATDDGDPLDWTLDEVVEFLCHNPQTPWSNSVVRIHPDPIAFEAALRDNFITGEVLLHDIDLKVLHEDLGMKAFGHRSSVIRAIQYLRKRSFKYQSTQEKSKLRSEDSRDVSPAASYLDQMSISYVGTPQREFPPNPRMMTPPVSGLGALRGKQAEHPLPSRRESFGNRKRNELATDGDSEGRAQESAVVDGEGRKRRRIQPLLQGQEITRKNDSSKFEDGREDKEWYMGPHKVQSSQLFYPFSSEDNDQTFVMLGPKFPTAQRLFVSKSLNYFHKQHPIKLPCEKGKEQWAVIPYRARDEETRRYFTLYTSRNGKVTVSQENADKWSLLRKSQDPAEDLSPSDPFAYLLQKYPVEKDVPDEACPVYGESGSEGEYDEDTWQEIDDEQRDTERGKPTKLSPSEVETAIKECVAEYENKWHEIKKPKEEQGAHSLWVRARRSRSANQQIKFLTKEIELQERRLKKVQETIRGNEYYAMSELKLLCQSMEHSVFNITKQRWRISVLEQDKCPPKVESAQEQRPKPKPKPRVDDEESLSSEDSDVDHDEPLDDFMDDSEMQDVQGEDFDRTDTDMQDLEDERPGRSPFRTQSPVRLSSNSSDDDIISLSGKKWKSKARKRNPLSIRSSSSPDVPVREQRPEPKTDLIDLTMDTPSPPANDLTIETPPLNPVVPNKSQPSSANVALKSERSSISPGPTLSQRISVEIPTFKHPPTKAANNELPDVNDFAALAKLSWTRIEERSDRGRLLAKLIGGLPDEERATMADYIPTYGVKRLKHHIRDALNVLTKSEKEIPGFSLFKNQLVMRTASLYISYVNCVHLSQEGISRHQIVEAQTSLSGFTSFFEVLCKHLAAYYDWKQNEETPKNNSPHKKRKKEVKESQHTKLNQESAQERVQNQENQREKLQKTWENMGISNDDPRHQVVSFGDPAIYLPSHIGTRVKPHQLRGVQFMWRELIEDKNQQGCLLAHTMGLGKTMQVISLLSTIAAATASDDVRIRKQVPEHLHRSQTLILCPSSLIDNWFEEFLMWMPMNPNLLGPLRKITATLKLGKRLEKVEDWNSEGGILMISYDIFRTWILNKETKARGRPFQDQESDQDVVQGQAKGWKCLSDEQHKRVKKWLLDGPSIIVADEAHKMKNANTGIAQAAVQFRSKSRIALTGSPLANNLTDYYTMVSWIAEGYLGEYKEFNANYVEPIEEGLYADSTYSERRKSLVKLQVLKEILEPKVNRADISALAGDLPPKVEFVITIPLTKLQKEAYNLYVNAVYGEVGDVGNPKLWSWLAILGLCCNHPKCFWDKLNNPTNEAPKQGQDALPGEESIDQAGLPDSASLVSRQKPLFTAVPDLKDLDLSYRTLMLNKIIAESVKTGDKVLIFSHSLPTLDYIEDVLKRSNRKYCRLDGRTSMGNRQTATKAFNKPGAEQIYIISTRAGGLGLNIPGANRVIIFDFQFNPVWEEQAVGRVYRLGQQKPVFVYRFISGGTFEEKIFGKAIFKSHLANRVVDKKNPVRWANKSVGEYLKPAGSVPQKDLIEFMGKDPLVLDKIIESDNGPERIIRKITLTETLQREDNDNLTEEEKQGVQMHLSDERLRRTDPRAYQALMVQRESERQAEQAALLAARAQVQPNQPNQYYLDQKGTAHSSLPHHPHPPPLSHNVGPRPLPPDTSISRPAPNPPANNSSRPFPTPSSHAHSPTSGNTTTSTTGSTPQQRPPPPSKPSVNTPSVTAPAPPQHPPPSNTDTSQGLDPASAASNQSGKNDDAASTGSRAMSIDGADSGDEQIFESPPEGPAVDNNARPTKAKKTNCNTQ
ncbi:putative SNF2 family helicase/ATPase [Aspergillus glaucus CBS 516.65]|uniref:SNF2 family helicase/ATPase n=1 Tax=Aspergillus glaucus CBS 516.65 TaxID=1160497 RepID=A0A1L9VTA7_ASPGL|nr:hypothetical protein ASPGLDRAFT_55635 [Aspergillus glaucus CBS 516.65]OJJ87151.1 hypothetical protein ASPGLDRAFT_55635 [Aspergillus glaucus CBS 516.65]